MIVKIVPGDISEFVADVIVVNIFEGMEYISGSMAAVDKALGNAITRLITDGEIKGKLNEVTIIHSLGRIPAMRVAVVGLGKQNELTLNKVRDVTAEACRQFRKIGISRVATVAHGSGVGGLDGEKVAQAVTEGALLGLYRFNKYMTPDLESHEIQEVILVEKDEDKIPALERGCNRGKVMAEATNFARDLVNEPANWKTPSQIAAVTQEMAKTYSLKCTVLGKRQIEEAGMGALLGVTQGSHEEPKFVVLHYTGDTESHAAVGLIGKGISFDSGGISLKPSQDMWEMKGDMAGAAAVIAAICAIAQIKPVINVTVLAPLTENLPGGAALKPGDILRAMNNKSIEVVTTDAEGRLILADALCYAQKSGLSPLVDVATLTGACVVALGTLCTGVFGNNQELINDICQAGDDAGELVWQMPMFEEYKELNKSDVADIKNSGGRQGGAITAAQFLAEFVASKPWVHLDIAGPFLSKEDKGYRVKGATGVAVRTLINYILSLSQKHMNGYREVLYEN